MKISLKIPTALSDIKLSQYQKFIKVTKDKEDVDFINRQLVSIFCDIPEDVVGKIKSKDFNNIIDTISKCLDSKPEFKTTFNLDGVKYGFIPDLEDITVDEQSDLELLLKEVKTWDKACAVMYRPITTSQKGKYLIEEYLQGVSQLEEKIIRRKKYWMSIGVKSLNNNLIKLKEESKGNSLDVSLDIALGAIGFFLNLQNDLLSYTLNYIGEEVERTPKLLQTLEESGVGIKTFMRSLEVVSLNLRRLVN